MLKALGSLFVKLANAIGHSSDSNSSASAAQASEQFIKLGLKQDPRRYKRATLLVGGVGVQQEIASASVMYRGKQYSVVDLSHTGIAFDRGSAKGGLRDEELPNPNAVETMSVSLGRFEAFSVKASLARHSGQLLAFEFSEVSTDARLTIDKFLDPKMIGLNMRAVDRSFFSAGETFSLWFCGPRDTNFFLWMSGGKLERSIVQLGEDHFTLHPADGGGAIFERTELRSSAGKNTPIRDSILFALDVALQIREGGDAISGLVRQLTQAADSN